MTVGLLAYVIDHVAGHDLAQIFSETLDFGARCKIHGLIQDTTSQIIDQSAE